MNLDRMLVWTWMIVNNVQTDPSRAAVQAVRSQVTSIALNNPQLRSEKVRQMIAENLIYQTVFLSASHEQVLASRDPSQIQQFVQMTNQSVTKDWGLDFRSVDLTDAGFRLRS